MTIGRIFRLGGSLYKFAWRPILGATALCFGAAAIVSVPIEATFGPTVNEWVTQVNLATLNNTVQPPIPSGLETAALAYIVASIVSFVLALVAGIAVVHITAAFYGGARVGALAAVRYALGRTGAMFGAQIVYFLAALLIVIIGFSIGGLLMAGGSVLTFLGLVVIVGTFAAVLFIAVRTTLVMPAIALEKLGALEGLSRSWRLVAGSGWRVLGYVIVIGLLAGLLGLLVGGLALALARVDQSTVIGSASASIVNTIVNIGLAPIGPIALTLLYFDLRWHHGERVPTPGGGDAAGSTDPPSGS